MWVVEGYIVLIKHTGSEESVYIRGVKYAVAGGRIYEIRIQEERRFKLSSVERRIMSLFTTGLINRQDSNVGRTHTYIMDVCSRSVKYYTSDTDHSSGFGHNILLSLT
ncbi:hypothetical protein EWB00_011080 [Schistosoma japonicum]|uniref:Uncharacterized protein n=1 Tax=Schistosoma japonicum TaxID=6182 RepID=A0A4Z2DLQ2_SCHJA|nr:hypothetical protein EWB00_011080 [Schistosoma japonicum]